MFRLIGLYRFDIDEVGVSALAVGRSARDHDGIALVHDARIARRALCKVKEHVDRVVLFAHHGNNAPTQRELLVGTRVGRHADDVDHGAEAGNHLCGAARARARRKGRG